VRRDPARGGTDPRAWGFAGPALVWTVAFFMVPFAVMALTSLSERASAGLAASWTLANYAGFFERGHFLQALRNSLEVTVLVTVISVLLAYPLA
jgi:spermidine/putrescine transport system permease protein